MSSTKGRSQQEDTGGEGVVDLQHNNTTAKNGRVYEGQTQVRMEPLD